MQIKPGGSGLEGIPFLESTVNFCLDERYWPKSTSLSFVFTRFDGVCECVCGVL
jgi:hypothetical protein